MKALAKGIDVSKWQGAIDWKKVKAAGVQFAMLKCTSGKNIADYFETNYKNAKAVGMPVGVFCYSYAKSVDGAKREAEAAIKILKGRQLEYPVAFDIEETSQKKLGKKTLTEMVKVFCETLEKAGYYVCLYTNLDWTRNYLDMNALSAYDLWLAQINKTVTYKGAYGMWQYSWTGKINGIIGDVDLDYAYKDYPSIIKKAGLNGYKKAAEKPASKPVEKPAEKEPASKPAKKPANNTATKYVKGAKIILKNKPIYSSAYTNVASGTRTGTFYLYDGEKINGRYRITVKKDMCGKKPTYQYVTGWINL